MSSTTPNPFDLVFDRLWDLAESHPDVTRLVKPGNRVRFDRPQRAPIKEEIADADLPELVLLPDGATFGLLRTSASSSVVKRYSWLVATGDFRTPTVNAIEWALFCAMLNAQSVLGALAWEDASFVKRVDLSELTEGFADSERNRGIRGWSAISKVEVEMHFRTATLLGWLA